MNIVTQAPCSSCYADDIYTRRLRFLAEGLVPLEGLYQGKLNSEGGR